MTITREVVTQYMTFALVGKTAKTNIWAVNNRSSGGRLGMVKWYGPWRQYCFFPEPDTVFNKGCLTIIMGFMVREASQC